MDIDVDQGLPNDLGKLILTFDGSYFFKDRNDRIEIDRFSREFDQYKIRRIESMEKSIKEINQNNDNKLPIVKYNIISVKQIIINTINVLQDIFYELLYDGYNKDTFLKNDRPFYLGIFLIFFGIILCIIL